MATNGDTDITLPTNRAKIYGNTWPKPQFSGAYLYKWEKMAGPEQGTIVGKNNKNAVLEDVCPQLCVSLMLLVNSLLMKVYSCGCF